MTLRLPGWWQDLASPEFAALDPEATVAVLPVGAIEQHGPHLPVAVDTCLNEAIVRRALELMPAGLPVLVLPTTAVGKSNEHIDFPGTLTLSAETLGRVWYEIGASRAAGGRAQAAPVQQPWRPAAGDADRGARAADRPRRCWWSPPTGISWGLPEGLFDAAEVRHGIHAGAGRDRDDAGGPPGPGRHGGRRRLRAGHRRRRRRLSAPAGAGCRRPGLADAGPASRGCLRRRDQAPRPRPAGR